MNRPVDQKDFNELQDTVIKLASFVKRLAARVTLLSRPKKKKAS